jgi:hypothetical protein
MTTTKTTTREAVSALHAELYEVEQLPRIGRNEPRRDKARRALSAAIEAWRRDCPEAAALEDARRLEQLAGILGNQAAVTDQRAVSCLPDQAYQRSTYRLEAASLRARSIEVLVSASSLRWSVAGSRLPVELRLYHQGHRQFWPLSEWTEDPAELIGQWLKRSSDRRDRDAFTLDRSETREHRIRELAPDHWEIIGICEVRRIGDPAGVRWLVIPEAETPRHLF